MSHDVLVIGAGCAGMRAAIEAHDAGADVAVVSKLHPTRSHSGAAEGGINAALGNAKEDSPEAHAYDTVKGSDFLGDQDAIEVFAKEAPGDIYQLENWGAVFTRAEDGRLAQRPFGAAGSPRTIFAADITGHVPDDLPSQCRLAWKNVEAQLRAAGMSFDNVVKITTILPDHASLGDSRKARAEAMGDRKPASTLIVGGLASPAWKIEIEVIACA